VNKIRPSRKSQNGFSGGKTNEMLRLGVGCFLGRLKKERKMGDYV
jgi:hypothetical protein